MPTPARQLHTTAVEPGRRLLRDVLLALAIKAVLLGLLWRLFFAQPLAPAVDGSGVAAQLAMPAAPAGAVHK